MAEVDDLLRTTPSEEVLTSREAEVMPWLGRAAAAIERWNPVRGVMIQGEVEQCLVGDSWRRVDPFTKLKAVLYQARADLRMDSGQLNVVLQKGAVFDYFDELRKVIEPAQKEVFFVDPYLDAEFVSRYLPSVGKGVSVRLLSGKAIPKLLPAVDAFARQWGHAIHVRSSGDLHDRFLFVDKSACYLSGASFKDGAKNAPATFTQINDGFRAMLDIYEGLWNVGKTER